MPSGVHLYIQRDFFRVQGVATSVLTVMDIIGLFFQSLLYHLISIYLLVHHLHHYMCFGKGHTQSFFYQKKKDYVKQKLFLTTSAML